MDFAPILSLDLMHAFYGASVPPIRVAPVDPGAFARAGLVLRQTGGRAILAAETGTDDRPRTVALSLQALDPSAIGVTCRADRSTIPTCALPLGQDEVAFDGLPATETRQRKVGVELARLDIALPPRGTRALPDGTPARVLRSTRPIAARARPDRAFALQRPGPSGPETVIPVLPAAGTSFRPADEPGGAARLQSDIFVTLW
ncbi:hypothetical protein [Rhodovulum marinum]|uniref:Uncharacterized protein n=1 Tax=Rhodovulum marinum TaxID=320662 RepID=A0A4V2SQS6_9RHOB|nr:hypothetical protein [Rhodovulum marinum]TCP40176.1 hypothetical protein EV662_10850 [Rhodovulum marinum]